MLNFRKVDQAKSKSDLAAEQIIDAIRAGKYAPGDRLPSERELAAAMGVSRGCMREALGALQVTGILRSRVGDGTYVSRSAEGELTKDILSLVREGVELLEIWRAKEELECQLLALAVENATTEELQELTDILGDMSDAVEGKDYGRYLLSNVRFHMAIARVARSSSLERAENSLLRVTQQIYRIAGQGSREAIADHLERALDVHARILDCIRKRDAEGVRGVMQRHFDEVAGFLTQVFG